VSISQQVTELQNHLSLEQVSLPENSFHEANAIPAKAKHVTIEHLVIVNVD
jgi:hypothetical protein